MHDHECILIWDAHTRIGYTMVPYIRVWANIRIWGRTCTWSIINNVQYKSTTYTHHFSDKRAGYNGGKLISKHTSMKATNLGINTKR